VRCGKHDRLQRGQSAYRWSSEHQSSKLRVAGSNPAGVANRIFRLLFFNYLAPDLANLCAGFATACSQLFFVDGILSQPGLVRRLRVSLHFAKAGVAADSRNLVRGASGFRKPPTGCLPQPVGRAMPWQARFVALIAEPIAEACGGERLAEFSDKES
jgi:hypothetical protein